MGVAISYPHTDTASNYLPNLPPVHRLKRLQVGWGQDPAVLPPAQGGERTRWAAIRGSVSYIVVGFVTLPCIGTDPLIPTSFIQQQSLCQAFCNRISYTITGRKRVEPKMSGIFLTEFVRQNAVMRHAGHSKGGAKGPAL